MFLIICSSNQYHSVSRLGVGHSILWLLSALSLPASSSRSSNCSRFLILAGLLLPKISRTLRHLYMMAVRCHFLLPLFLILFIIQHVWY